MARKKRPPINLNKPTPAPKNDMDRLFAGVQGVEQASGLQLLAIRIEAIVPDPNQPRNTFPEASLKELSESIRQDGVIQPIEVTQINPNQYQIVHGERRWRAARLAGLATIPAIVQRRTYDEVNRFVRQMVENIQREDLNDIDRAHGIMRLRDLMQEELDRARAEGVPSNKPWSKKITWPKVGARLGLSKQRISQLMNLLKLPDEIQASVREGVIRERDARRYQGLKLSQQKALHQLLLVGDVTATEADDIAKMLKQQPNLTVSQAVRILNHEESEDVWGEEGDWLEEERPYSDSDNFYQTESAHAISKRIEPLHWIRRHLAGFRTRGLTAYEQDEALRLLDLIQQDVDSLTAVIIADDADQ